MDDLQLWRLYSAQEQRTNTGWPSHKSERSALPVNDKILRRPFSAAWPDWKWVTDLTEHPSAVDGICYLAIWDLLRNLIKVCGACDRMPTKRGSKFRSYGLDSVLTAARRPSSSGRIASSDSTGNHKVPYSHHPRKSRVCTKDLGQDRFQSAAWS